jgi:3-hydroxybutyryl-CoA dehydrogenase
MIVVIGGGTMGAGIATSFLAEGERVRIVESSPEAAEAASDRVRSSLERVARKRAQLHVDAAMGSLELATEHIAESDVELVVEAVPEHLELKQRILASIEGDYGETCVLASNTSSLSITEIASVLRRPERCIGMHFFNPVPVSSLVEIVVGDRTTDETVALARHWVERLDKTPIVVRDSPGFASSRLGVALGLEAIRMVEEGVASAADIDTAMKLGYRHPMGPLELTDLVGVDVRLAIAEHLERELGARFTPPALMRRMVADGELGKKSGTGFYDWD